MSQCNISALFSLGPRITERQLTCFCVLEMNKYGRGNTLVYVMQVGKEGVIRGSGGRGRVSCESPWRADDVGLILCKF